MDQSQKQDKCSHCGDRRVVEGWSFHGPVWEACWRCSKGMDVKVLLAKKHSRWPCLGESLMILAMILFVGMFAIPLMFFWKLTLCLIFTIFFLVYAGSRIHESHPQREEETKRVIID